MLDKGNIEWGIYVTKKYYKTDSWKLSNNHGRAKKSQDIKELKNEINGFKVSLQFTENELKEKMESLKKKQNMKIFVQRLMKSMIPK